MTTMAEHPTAAATSSRRPLAAIVAAAAGLSASLVLLAAAASLPAWRRRDREIDELRRTVEALRRRLDLDGGTGAADDGRRAAAARALNVADDSEGDPYSRSVDRSLQTAGCGCASSYTYASDFGVVGDAQTDDAAALQAAIDSAASNDGEGGGTVILPKGTFLTMSPLIVPGGVTLRGQGYGSSPLAIQFDAGASTVAYCGTDYAVKLTGHGAGLHDLAVYDWRYPAGEYCDTVKAAGGVLVDADGRGVESIRMNNVLFYWFMGGTSLELRARNAGLIAFGSFDNLIIRHAHTGILMTADETSVCNSNSFNGGAIWGSITEVAVRAEGPGACNDNKFTGTTIEPAYTELAHVYVTGSKTNLKLLDVRMEGTEMFAANKPLVIIDDSSYGNVMNGVFGHTNVRADLNRNPGIDFATAKTVGVDPAPRNLYWNAGFHGFDAPNRILPGWSLVGTNAALEILPDTEETHAGHRVLRVDYLNYGGAFKLTADSTPQSPAHSFATFGVYARSSVPGSVVAAMRYESGSIIASSPHSGSGEWEFIGMSALYDRSAPYFYFSVTGDVDLTAPVFTYGHGSATPGASLLSSDGARMAGTLSLGMASVYPPPSATPYYWVLPKNGGNLFRVETEGDPFRTIIRLNHSAGDRFDRGSVITLLFTEAGTTVRSSAYIELKDDMDFVSKVHSSITLVSEGSASWYEVTRNE